MSTVLQAPFPYFGGKSKVARVIWTRFGRVRNYVEPFFGSGAVLLANPYWADCVETANDACGFVANFFRSVRADPETTAYWADQQVNENDLHAVHSWLVSQDKDLVAKLEGDPDYFDAKIAGRWCWGMCCWIGGGWCSDEGPWTVVDGRLVNTGHGQDGGVIRRLPHLGNAGRGVNRQRPNLRNAGQGVSRRRPHLGAERGVNRQLPRLGDAGLGVHRLLDNTAVHEWFGVLSERFRRVRVCCGDWSRVLGPTPTFRLGTTAVFLDPPYSAEAGRDNGLYHMESGDVAHKVRDWCLANGDNDQLRIALCGYVGEGHDVLTDHGWASYRWKNNGGYATISKQAGNGKRNRDREVVFFSPHCINPELDLFHAQESLDLEPTPNAAEEALG